MKPKSDDSGSFLSPVALWLGLQLAAIALAVTRIPLWAQAPKTQEIYALQFLMATQVAVSSLLHSWLLPDWKSVVFAIATAWPMIFLAGLLSPLSIGTVVMSAVYITGWLFALALIIPPLRTTEHSFAGAALLSLWAVGGSFLLFIHEEYGSYAPPTSRLFEIAWGPIVWAVRFTDESAHQIICISLLLATSLFVRLFAYIFRKSCRTRLAV